LSKRNKYTGASPPPHFYGLLTNAMVLYMANLTIPISVYVQSVHDQGQLALFISLHLLRLAHNPAILQHIAQLRRHHRII
jgi:hypothetical protein